ncbi:MAG: ammonium permease [Cyanothece sp. SIO1E1]|nr:ammonium permease [Cyanothece sp. SIO1E1]
MYIYRDHKLKPKSNPLLRRCYICLSLSALFLVIMAEAATAQVNTANSFDPVNTLWMLIAASLVFFMNAGFAMLEAGSCRTQNAVNILAKNLIVFCIAALAFWLVGFGFMFGDGGNGLLGLQGFFPELLFPREGTSAFPKTGFQGLQEGWPGRSFAALFFFQLVFAGTAATIVSGAVAERIKFWAFVLFSIFIVGFAYPLTGCWVWGVNGWLNSTFNFQDFAGSTVVHSVGGAAGLVGAILLRPRQGRFGYNHSDKSFADAETEDFASDNLGFSTLGCLILWLGWFGFNGGSTKYIEYVPHIVTTTMIAAAAGGISAVFFSPSIIGQSRFTSILNGVLGGLVAITASSAYVDIKSSIIIGAIGGIVVLLGEFFLERVIKIDDPVGAIPVHLFCGLWGTLAVGIFSDANSLEYTATYSHLTQTLYQLLGWSIIFVTTVILSLITWLFIGIFLHYWSQLNQQMNDKSVVGEKRADNSQPFDLIKFLLQHFEMGRNGIRVSAEDEKFGRDGFFL